MKMLVNGMDYPIEFEEKYVNVLEIDNNQFFSSLINKINNRINGIESDNEILLIQDDESLKFDKECVMIIDIFNFDFNDRKILNKFYEQIVKYVELEQEKNIDIQENIVSLKSKIISIIDELDFNYTYKENNKIVDVLKMLDIKLENNYSLKVMDKVLYLIDLISSLNIYKIIIFVNLKLYLNQEEVLEIYKYSKYKNINILLLENIMQENKLEYEKKNIIDKEFNDFLVK